MKVTAKLNYLHISPRKVRILADVIKGMNVWNAVNQLKFWPNKAADPLGKLLKSAIANAEHNFSLVREDLKITGLKVDCGPVFRRFRPGSRGRVSPINKRTSHITLVLEGERVSSHDDKSRKVKDDKDNINIVGAKKEANSIENTVKTINKKDVFKKIANKKASSPGFVKRVFRRKSV